MNQTEEFFNQASLDPIESILKFNEFITQITLHISWNKIGFLSDEKHSNQIFLLLQDDEVLGTFRLNLPLKEILSVLSNCKISNELEFRNYQGKIFTEDDLSSIGSLSSIWQLCHAQSSNITFNEFAELLDKIKCKRWEKGRNHSFTTKTTQKVMLDSHGFCMFKGCGERLDIDDLTGENGNYSYKAHNVASSEMGPRGVSFLSEKLSDDPNNIILLCDKHHRLIDKIAVANYNASTLSKMRTDFIETAKKLLGGLSYQPIPVYCVLWPIGNSISACPESGEISNCLSHIKSRMKGDRNDICDNDKSLVKNPQKFISEMDEIVKDTAAEIKNQSKKHQYKVALFAFGPMPALVGLGALLGNKGQFTPMLRYRDGNCWVWPKNTPIDTPYTVEGEDQLHNTNDVILSIALTNHPEVMQNKANDLGHPHLLIKAKEMGNGAIPHPENGNELTLFLHDLLKQLKDKYKVKKVHLLICASNAACVFVGQAFDLHQPDLLIYDFENGDMLPRLQISSKNNNITVTLP